MNLSIQPADSESEESRALVNQMFLELKALYGLVQPTLQPINCPREGAVFLVARENDRPVACGAVVPLSPGIGEVKRMFVEKDSRGRGISRAVLAELERHARTLGYTALRLDTGIRQPAAILLYETSGFERIPNYIAHITDELTVCYEKKL
jgi:putative acetyltransferase